jgi:hypothetical protein
LNNSRLSFIYEDFVDHLSKTNEPRLGSIAVRYFGAASGALHTESLENRSTSPQVGTPQGLSNITISAAIAEKKLVSLWDFSKLNHTRMASLTAPSFLVSHAHTQLLLAEAVVREWTTGNAVELYANLTSAEQAISR